MFSCIGKKKSPRSKKDNNEKPKIVKFIEDPADSDEDIDADEEWIQSQYESKEFTPEKNENMQLERILGQRKCRGCDYIEYHISFKPICVPSKNYKEFARTNSIKNVTKISQGDESYHHVECPSQWVSESDMLYISFTSIERCNFIIMARSSDCYEINHFYCDCPRNEKFNPDRWDYYKTYQIS